MLDFLLSVEELEDKYKTNKLTIEDEIKLICDAKDVQNITIDCSKYEIKRYNFVNKYKLNDDKNLIQEYLNIWYSKDKILDNVLAYYKIINRNDEQEQQIKYVNKVLECFGFNDLFDFETTCMSNNEFIERAKLTEFWKFDIYKEIMLLFGKRQQRAKQYDEFELRQFIKICDCILSDFAITLNNKRLQPRINQKKISIRKYTLAPNIKYIEQIMSYYKNPNYKHQ